MVAFATRRGRAEDGGDGARRLLEPLAGRALGEGRDERQRHRGRTACSSTATPTASSTRASRAARRATRARRAASSRSSRAAELAPASGQPQTLLATLEAVLESRKKSTGAASYTKSLYDAGADGHLGASCARRRRSSGAQSSRRATTRVVSEAADTLYHLIVALRWRGLPLRRVLAELGRRLGTSGHAEKAQRSTKQAAARGVISSRVSPCPPKSSCSRAIRRSPESSGPSSASSDAPPGRRRRQRRAAAAAPTGPTSSCSRSSCRG